MDNQSLDNYKSILYCTQSNSLSLFNDFHSEISKKINFENTSFIVADSRNYFDWKKSNPKFEDDKHLIKEWEITSQKSSKVDLKKLKDYEKKLGTSPGIFSSIIADRRLIMGKNSSITQDYTRRFTDEELMSILLYALETTEKLFEETKPDILVGFICVTFLEYIAYLFAKSKNIKILNLRPTRISDRVIFSNTLNDPDNKLASKFEEIVNGRESKFYENALSYYEKVKSTNSHYEGVISVSDAPGLASSAIKLFNPLKVKNFITKYTDYFLKGIYKDNHVMNPVTNFIYASVINPLKAKLIKMYLKNKYINEEDLGAEEYIFFPLHTEPEVSLLVYGRPFVNQIEIIRMIAISMPIGKTLYVKEHPWMIGKRSLSAYKKILDIPRVKLISPSIESRKVVNKCELVAVITGSIALEAAIIGKPVITFGDCPYNLLPDLKVTRVRDIRNLDRILNKIIHSYKYDKKTIIAYIAANYEVSESVNLYSSLLKKQNVHQERDEDYISEINNLVNYAVRSIKDNSPINISSKDVAKW